MGATRAEVLQRTTPIVGGVGLLTAGAFVALVDPAAPGSRFPACNFLQLTGYWCPGCGLTRGAHELLQGDVLGALSHNLFTPVALVAALGLWFVWLRRSWGGTVRWWPLRLPRWTAATLIAVVAVYGVLRNVPAAPFEALAP